MVYDVKAMLTVASKVAYEGEPVTPGDLDLDEIDSPLTALEVYSAARRQVAAAKAIEKAAGDHLALLLGEGGAARTGDNILRYRVARKEQCIDPAGAGEYITRCIKNDELVFTDVVNPQYVKRGWMGEAVRETFFEWVDDENPSLDVVPVSRAPKFLSFLEEGEVFVKSRPAE